MKHIQKPEGGEYAPYTIMYIGLLPDDGLVMHHLQDNMKITRDLVLSLPEENLTSRPTPDAWRTIKEILVHLSDDERIYTYRALRFARNDTTELPGFVQDDYVEASGANERRIKDILEEYTAVRMATIAFFNSLEEAAFKRAGVSNGHCMSVRAAVYHIAGHELQHIKQIQKNSL